MSIYIMVFLGAICEGLIETLTKIAERIDEAIERRRFVTSLRNRRMGHRADYKTKMKYKLESIIDNIIAPN